MTAYANHVRVDSEEGVGLLRGNKAVIPPRVVKRRIKFWMGFFNTISIFNIGAMCRLEAYVALFILIMIKCLMFDFK